MSCGRPPQATAWELPGPAHLEKAHSMVLTSRGLHCCALEVTVARSSVKSGQGGVTFSDANAQSSPGSVGMGAARDQGLRKF